MPPPPSEIRSGARLKMTLIGAALIRGIAARFEPRDSFSSNQSSVRSIACAIVSVGRQPSARIREVSRWISGLSPTQPAPPPVYSISGERPEVLGDDRDRVVDDDASHRCRGCR